MDDFYNLIFEIFKFIYFELKEYLKIGAHVRSVVVVIRKKFLNDELTSESRYYYIH